MDFAELRFWSVALDRWARMSVFIPPGRGPHPVVLLLHGLGGDAQSWTLDYELHPLLTPLRSIVVMPDAGNGYYVDDPRPSGSGRIESFIMNDTMGFVDRVFQTRREPENRAVAGISMGGYGALMLALRHPDVFGRAAALSPSLYFAHQPHPKGSEMQTRLAEALPRGAYDCFDLARKAAKHNTRPELWISIGQSDPHLGVCRDFHHLLNEFGWTHEFHESEGGHDRAFWAPQLPAMLDFLGGRKSEA